MAIVWLNGELFEESRARVSALDRGLLWGYGLFETLRAYAGRVWAFEDHYDRLQIGAEVLDIPCPSSEWIGEGMEAVLRANRLSDAGVRVTVTRGAGPPEPHADPTEPPNVIVGGWELADYSQLYEDGVALVAVSGGRVLAGVKTTSYAQSVAGRVAARRAGADDALFIGEEGLVLETTGSNLYAVFGDALLTPPVEDGVLPGVTRQTILRIAPECGLQAEEVSLELPDLFRADEVLLSSSLREVYPVRSIDGRAVGMGPLATRVREKFGQVIRSALSGTR